MAAAVCCRQLNLFSYKEHTQSAGATVAGNRTTGFCPVDVIESCIAVNGRFYRRNEEAEQTFEAELNMFGFEKKENRGNEHFLCWFINLK